MIIMQLPKGAVVAVADGAKLHLFRNTSDDAQVKLSAMPDVAVEKGGTGSSAGHRSSSANPDNDTQEEDGFAAGVAALLNKQVLEGGVTSLAIVAAPRTLGELRKHYHQKLEAALAGEVSKDLASHSVQDIEKAIAAA
jgi:protein required for attachment to host cells